MRRRGDKMKKILKMLFNRVVLVAYCHFGSNSAFDPHDGEVPGIFCLFLRPLRGAEYGRGADYCQRQKQSRIQNCLADSRPAGTGFRRFVLCDLRRQPLAQAGEAKDEQGGRKDAAFPAAPGRTAGEIAADSIDAANQAGIFRPMPTVRFTPIPIPITCHWEKSSLSG